MTAWLRHHGLAVAILLAMSVPACKPKVTAEGNKIPGLPDGRPADAESTTSDKPSVNDVTGFLRAASPSFARLTDVKMDPPTLPPNTSPAQRRWLCSVRFGYTPTEDLLGSAPAPDAQAFQAVADELAAWSRWREAYARSSYALLYPAPAWRAPASPSPAGQPILIRLHPAGQPLPPIYTKLVAEWQVDHWQFHATDLDLPDFGEPRAAFTSPNVVLGSAEATAFVQAAQAAITQSKATKADMDARYRMDIAKAVHPGVLFTGQLTHRSSVVPVEVRVLPAANGSTAPQDVNLEVRLPATPGESFTYQAELSAQVPLELPAASAADASAPIAAAQALASLPQGDLRLRLINTTGKEAAYNESVPVKLLFISRHYAQPPAVWLHLRDGHLDGRLGGYDTDPTGFVLSAKRQGTAP